MKRTIFTELAAIWVAFTFILLVTLLAAWFAGAVTVSDGVVCAVTTGAVWIVAIAVIIELLRKRA